MRTKLTPKIQEQLNKLKQVPVSQIRGFVTPLVEVPIGELSLKMSHRALYVLSSTLVQMRDQTNKLADIFEKRENKIKALIEEYEKDPKTEKYVLEDLKGLLVDEEELKKRMTEKSSKLPETKCIETVNGADKKPEHNPKLCKLHSCECKKSTDSQNAE